MLATIFAMAAGVWVGGLVTVTLVVVSSRTMGSGRVALFRSFGRKFAVFFGVNALIVVAPSVILAVSEPRPLATAAALLAIVLLLATAIGILQARRMTALRSAQDAGSTTETLVRRQGTIAAIIRTALVIGYVALLVLGVLLAGSV